MLRVKQTSVDVAKCVLFNEVYDKVAADYYGVGCKEDNSKQASAFYWALNSCCDITKCKIADFFDRFDVKDLCGEKEIECGGVVPCKQITIEVLNQPCERSCANIDQQC